VYANYGRPHDFKVLDKLGVDTNKAIIIMRYGKLSRGKMVGGGGVVNLMMMVTMLMIMMMIDDDDDNDDDNGGGGDDDDR
jgi:hypothetical protein